MRIANAMFAKGMGGIEQAFLDYSRALSSIGRHSVVSFHHPDSAVGKSLEEISTWPAGISNFSQYDPVAVVRIAKRLREDCTDIVIAHGNRAAELMRKAAWIASRHLGYRIPIVGLAHNYTLKHIVKLDAVFATTDDLARRSVAAGMSEPNIFVIPNMIFGLDRGGIRRRPVFRKPPVIGAMGRFVKKKGFEQLLEAFSLLRKQGVPFHGLIGGAGEEESALRRRLNELSLQDQVEIVGWVADKKRFFESIDLFVLPSLHEPFGIVLLEAFMSGVPVITTDAEGPAQIVSNGKDALLVGRSDPGAMAMAISRLLVDPALAASLASEAWETVSKTYAAEVVSTKIEKALSVLVAKSRSAVDGRRHADGAGG